MHAKLLFKSILKQKLPSHQPLAVTTLATMPTDSYQFNIHSKSQTAITYHKLVSVCMVVCVSRTVEKSLHKHKSMEHKV